MCTMLILHGPSSPLKPQHQHRHLQDVFAYSKRNTFVSKLTETHLFGRKQVLDQAAFSSGVPWQGNAAKHLKIVYIQRVAHCKVSRSLPSLASADGSRDQGNSSARQNTRLEAAGAHVSTIASDVWSDEKATEIRLPLEGSGGIPTDKGSLLESNVVENHDDSESLERSFAIGTDQRPHQDFVVSGSDDREIQVSALCSGASVEVRSIESMQATDADSPLLKQEDHAPGAHAATSTTSTTCPGTNLSGFWQVLENDINFMSDVWKGFKAEALPSMAENVEKAVTLRLWENPSSPKYLKAPTFQPYSPGMSALDILAADYVAVGCLMHFALGWLKAWQIPLEPRYDPHEIAAYFNRRPHVLAFRILQVSAVFGLAVLQLELEKILKPAEMDLENSQRRRAELIRSALITLGPTFIKVGQSLSTRPDLIGANTAKVLSELQDNLPPFPTHQAISIIEGELGGPLNTFFSDISEVPVAAASFGQVYKGRTIDCQDVAVKVQRPNLLHSLSLDIYILRMGLALIRKIAKRRSDLKLYADELGHGFFGELDYIQEANNAMEFQEAHKKLTFLRVPKTLSCLSTRKVLTMEWIQGDRPTEMLLFAEMPNQEDVSLRERQLRMKQRLFTLVNKGIEASLVQLLDTGILHADPHPGNMLYTEDGQMVFLDFGLLCRMERHHQLAMLASVAHIVNADWKSFVQDLADMEVFPPFLNRRQIVVELEEALGDTVQEGVPDIKFSKVLVKVLGIALKNQFKMPPYFILVLRSIASLEGLALAVDPDFKVFASSYPFVLQRLLTDNSVPLQKVLSSLVLNDKKQFRWDRLASFATLAQQHTLKRVALEVGMEVQATSLTEYDVERADPQLIQLLVNLLLSEKGAVFRQLILEADTFELARLFNSGKVATLRRNVARTMAVVLYELGMSSLKSHVNMELQKAVETTSNHLSIPDDPPVPGTGIISDKSLTEDMKLLVDCSDTIDISLLGNKHLRTLLWTGFTRLRRRPLLLVQTGWTSFTMLCYAMALAAHRLAISLCLKIFDSKLGRSFSRQNHHSMTVAPGKGMETVYG